MRWIVTALLVLALAVPASAYTCNQSGCTWTTSYVEPSALTNGQPLTDLASCTLIYTTSVDGGAPGPAKSVASAASKPSGGGTINKTITDAAMAPNHTYAISEVVTCTSTAFGTSAPSASATLPMNNGVAPNPTAAPTLQ